MLKPKRIKYADLNAKQKESFNYQKVSAVLADWGFSTVRLYDDWQGADFIAQHVNGIDYLRVQLKGRVAFDKKYIGKGIHICFPAKDYSGCYLYPHDKLLSLILEKNKLLKGTKSWDERGMYDFRSISIDMVQLLKPYLLTSSHSYDAVT